MNMFYMPWLASCGSNVLENRKTCSSTCITCMDVSEPTYYHDEAASWLRCRAVARRSKRRNQNWMNVTATINGYMYELPESASSRGNSILLLLHRLCTSTRNTPWVSAPPPWRNRRHLLASTCKISKEAPLVTPCGPVTIIFAVNQFYRHFGNLMRCSSVL